MLLKRRVLIFHSGALGDFVLTWPLAVALARIHPQSRISYVTQSEKGKLAEAVLGIEWTDIEAGWHALYKPACELPQSARNLLRGAHTVVTFVADAEQTWISNAGEIAGDIPILPITPPPRDAFEGHAADFILQQLNAWPVVATAVEQILKSTKDKGLGAGWVGGDEIIVHPGSGSPDKCWPIEKFAELGQMLASKGKSVRFILGEVEADRWSKAQIESLKSAAPVSQLKTYLDLWEVLKHASAFIGNDSGPGHLAGISGMPTLILFGPTREENWRPLGPRVQILHNDTLENLSVSQVLKALPTPTARRKEQKNADPD